MSRTNGLAHRSRKILFGLVAEYIATGEPVGSRTLSRKYVSDLSPATIRNVLSDLEETGFLLQPHASAGRIPSERALRAFIDALTDFEDVSSAQQREMVVRFEEIFSEHQENSLRETGAFLSELSGAAAIVTTTPTDSRKLLQLRFIPTRPGQVLAVLVFHDGSVENRFIDVDEPVREHDLMRIHELFADVVEGRTLASLRELLSRRAQDERVRVDELRRTAFELGSRAVQDIAARTEIVIEGGQRLAGLPEYGDVERLRMLIRALEDRAHLLSLLDRTIEAGATIVHIGNEAGDSADLGAANLSLVSAPYGADGSRGTVGVLGPTRMDYAKVVPLVDAAAAAMTAAIKKTQ
ncbi:MAG: heat-inducible transcription repressor HrcA [Deltaproteobacteria bacterium]|nr:heat-inducible transcription repressor HrcA [Deltaproteobacteria bacterium]